MNVVPLELEYWNKAELIRTSATTIAAFPRNNLDSEFRSISSGISANLGDFMGRWRKEMEKFSSNNLRFIYSALNEIKTAIPKGEKLREDLSGAQGK